MQPAKDGSLLFDRQGEKVASMKRSKQSIEEDKQKSMSMHIRSGAGGVAKSRKK
jgi:hypothetical protein